MHQRTSDDAVLLEHLQLANQQLRQVLAAAGCSLPELSLPANFAQLQEDEAMALLAEENYQLRQLLQQLQQQQQLQDLEQQLILQQELELKRSALEFDRLSPSPEQQQGVDPAPAAAVCAETPQFGSPMAAGRSGAYGSVSAAAAPENATVMLPAAARLVAAPSLNTVQLVEAEAAAQLATQAVIHAEAVAHHHMPWQPQDPPQDDHGHDMSAAGHVDPDELNLVCHERLTDVEHAGSHGGRGCWQQPLGNSTWQHGTTAYPAVPTQAQVQCSWMQAPAAETGAHDHQQQQRQLDSSGCMVLPQLPRLLLPAAVRNPARSSCHVEAKGLPADSHLRPPSPAVVALQGCEQPAQTSMGMQQFRLSAFVSADAATAAAAAAADLPDVLASDQWQRQLQRQSQPPLPPPLQQLPQQQQQQHDLHMPMLGLPPIATTAVRSRLGGPANAAQATSAAVSQAAAAAAALAQQSFYPQQQQQQQLLLPLPALRLPPKAQTYEQQQYQHTALPPLLEHQPMPSSSATSSWHADVPLSLPKLRLPALQHSAAAGSSAAGPSTCADAASHSSSPEDSPCSDSAFFRAADAVLFDGSSSGLFDGGTDLFGARISMDDSGNHLSCSEAQPSQLPDVPEDYFGLPESTANSFQGLEHGSSYCHSQQSGWLGVSYQQQSMRAGQYGNFSTGRASEEFQRPYAGASAEYGSFSSYPHCRGMMGQGAAAGVGMSSVDELSELHEGPLARQDTWSGSGFIATAAAGSMSSLTSGMLSNQVSFRCPLSTQQSAASGSGTNGKPAAAASREQEQLLALPNLAPLRVATSRQQEHTPPMTWQPRPLQGEGSSSSNIISASRSGRLPASAAAAAAAAATSPAHMAATEAAEAAASVGLAAAATGGMDSQQLQQLLHHLARVAEEASTTVAAAAAAAAGSPAPSSMQHTPHAAAAADAAADAADAAGTGTEVAAHVCPEQQQQQQQPEQLRDAVAAVDAQCCTPTSNTAHALRQTLSGPILGQQARPLSPFAAAGTQSPAPAGTAFLVMSPRPPMLQRTLSAGQMAHGCAIGLPPKWASRSGSSSNLAALHTQQQQQHVAPLQRPQQQEQCSGYDADSQAQGPVQSMGQAPAGVAVPGLSAADRAATVPVATSAGGLISPRLGLHRRLRVNTHAAGPAGAAAAGCASNGSNSDAEAGSAHTTPMHRPPQGAPVQRTSSGSSFRPAGLASITVPPSPASSGVRYVPASPRVVGFDCPLTPHVYALRSPSWRSEVGVEGSSMGCGSGASTPRRQASSPGLLQQALARSGLAPHQHHSQPQLALSGAASAAGSSCNTPCSAARRGAAGAGASGFAAAAAVPGAGVFHDKLQVGSHGSSSCGVPRTAGSCSSSTLLMTMMGGQLPMLHQRTYSSPYLDTMQSPKAAPRMGRGSASGHLEAADDTARQAAAPAAEQAHVQELLRTGNSHASSSSNGSSPGHKRTGSSDAVVRGSAAAAEAVAVDACVDVSRSVSPQLAAPNSRSISPQLQHETSPRAQGPAAAAAAAAAAGDAGHPRLSRFGLAAARAGVGVEKPAVASAKEEAHCRLPACVTLTAIMPVGSQQGDGASSALHDCPCASGSSSSRQQGGGEQAVLEEAAAAAAGGAGHAVNTPAVTGVGPVAVPDTPALDALGVVGAFSGQCSSLSTQGCAPTDEAGTASLAGVLIEQELQRVEAEACCSAAEATSSSAARHCSQSVREGLSPAAGAFEACASGSNNPGCSRKGALSGGACCSGDAAASRQTDASWQPAAMRREGSNALEQQHQPPASPCTPQQDAKQQQPQQQQLQSPEGQQHHLDQQGDWQLQQQGRWQQQRAQHQAIWSGHTTSSPHKACALPRSKSAAAYLSGGNCSAAAAAAGAAVQGSAGQGPNSTSGMWSPTHDVRGGSSRHRAPSALLMRLSQRQVEVLLSRGKSTSAVPYVLPHRSSNPASALRALASTGSGEHSSSHGQGHSSSQDPALLSSPHANAASRSSLELPSSGSSPHASQHLEGRTSWEVEQLHVPQDLLDVASSAAAVPDLYIPLPRADSAAVEAQQQQQHQLRQRQVSDSDVIDAAAGPSDQHGQLLSACIVQQRLKSTGKWLGPAPVVSTASTAAAEAEAAAVVTRRRSSQFEAPGSGLGLQRSMSSGTVTSPSSSGGRVGSRVAMTAAVLAVSSGSGAAGAAAAGAGPVRVSAKLRSASAWRADADDSSPVGAQGGTGVQQRARQGARLQHQPNPEQHEPNPEQQEPRPEQQGERQCTEPDQQQEQQQQQQERSADSGVFAGGSAAMPSSCSDASLQPAGDDAALVGEAVSASSTTEATGPAVLPQQQQQQLSLVPNQRLTEAEVRDELQGLLPVDRQPGPACDLPGDALSAAAAAAACEPPASAVQDVLPAVVQQQQAVGPTLSQPAAWPAGDSGGGSQDAAHQGQDGVSALPGMPDKQQQQQMLMWKQQQGRKQREVAEWARLLLQQQQQQLEQEEQQQQRQEVFQSVPVAGAAAASTASAAADTGVGSLAITASSMHEAAAVMAPPSAPAVGAALTAAAVLPAASTALDEASQLVGGVEAGCLGMQRVDSACISIADSFEVHSWAAWSTTSSINRCPKLQWWGDDAGQGRFSTRQRSRRQQQGSSAGGGGSVEAQVRWWQRLLQARQAGGSWTQ